MQKIRRGGDHTMSNEKLVRVKVDHNGHCAGFNYVQGEEVELPESVVAALGDHATPIAGKVEEVKEEVKEVGQTDVEDKMIKKAEVITK